MNMVMQTVKKWATKALAWAWNSVIVEPIDGVLGLVTGARLATVSVVNAAWKLAVKTLRRELSGGDRGQLEVALGMLVEGVGPSRKWSRRVSPACSRRTGKLICGNY